MRPEYTPGDLAGWFWQQVNRAGPIPEHRRRLGPCWLWTGPTKRGYGSASFEFRVWRAHRLSWELHRGPIPEGIHVLHRCDNKACVNPAHLFLGTDRDNALDRDVKGRNGNAKLTSVEVTEILRRRAAGEGVNALGREYGVSGGQITHITKGQSWRHLARLENS